MTKTANPIPRIEIFQPKLVSRLREGYDLSRFRADAIAGITVAVVALPLSMAIAIASGASPAQGLYTAIVGGFLISLLGGSSHQIGGPAGAFIVLVAATIERHGFDGLMLATILAGIMMLAIGMLRFGTLIRYIPEPVTIGFTAGIAVIIFASQIRDMLGLVLAAREPAALLPKLGVLVEAVHTFNPYAIGVALLSLGVIVGLKVSGSKFPGFLVAIIISTLVVQLFGLPVETIGSRFGSLPTGLPMPAFPAISLARIQDVLPAALAIALLGSIESLLSAVVADGMTGRRHRSNTELIAQGVANIASALFGGVCATGTIARTATNVRAGGQTPVAGMLHSVFLLVAMASLAPLLVKIPLAALGATLAFIAWNMAERHTFMALIRSNKAEASVLLATFLLTIFRDLIEGILVGVVLGAILFAVRMAKLAEMSGHLPALDGAKADSVTPEGIKAGDVSVYRLDGPLFFGTAPNLQDVLARIGASARVIIFDFKAVPLVDSSGVAALMRHLENAKARSALVIFAAVSPQIDLELQKLGLPETRVTRAPDLASAYVLAKTYLSPDSGLG